MGNTSSVEPFDKVISLCSLPVFIFYNRQKTKETATQKLINNKTNTWKYNQHPQDNKTHPPTHWFHYLQLTPAHYLVHFLLLLHRPSSIYTNIQQLTRAIAATVVATTATRIMILKMATLSSTHTQHTHRKTNSQITLSPRFRKRQYLK